MLKFHNKYFWRVEINFRIWYNCSVFVLHPSHFLNEFLNQSSIASTAINRKKKKITLFQKALNYGFLHNITNYKARVAGQRGRIGNAFLLGGFVGDQSVLQICRGKGENLESKTRSTLWCTTLYSWGLYVSTLSVQAWFNFWRN